MSNTTKAFGESAKGVENTRDFVIVIGREYGSGGREYGKFIAENLGVPYYDKLLLQQAAERLGYSEGIFRTKDEKRPSRLRGWLSLTYGAPLAELAGMPMGDEKIYECQSRVIKEACNRGSCVIVGRTADYIMRNHPGLLSIFIHAPENVRALRIISRGECNDKASALELHRKRDKERGEYYRYYTNRGGWGRCNNYHLSIDSSRISKERVLELVRAMIAGKGLTPDAMS